MACLCSNPEICEQSTIEGVVYCTCTQIIFDIICPSGCVPVLQEDGNAICECTDSIDPIETIEYDLIDVNDPQYFQDISWTLAYKPTEGTWVSFYSFKPTYYVANQDYFQSGWNTTETLWNHPLSNSSFQVFCGQLFPFKVEYPIINQNNQKTLNTISLNIESKRWQNKWDFAVNKEIGFNKVAIWNNTNHSGMLNLIPQKSPKYTKNYPKTKTDGTQDILYTPYHGKHTFNYFFNRVKNQDSNIPTWLWDYNRIEKTPNRQALSFTGKRVLERMEGEMFNVLLENNKESRYSITLKNATNKETIE